MRPDHVVESEGSPIHPTGTQLHIGSLSSGEPVSTFYHRTSRKPAAPASTTLLQQRWCLYFSHTNGYGDVGLVGVDQSNNRRIFSTIGDIPLA